MAGVALGKHDFGTQALKNLAAVHVGVSSTGKMLLRVGDGKNTYTYMSRRADAELRAQRFDTGRGCVPTTAFDPVGEGEAFELDNVTFNVQPEDLTMANGRALPSALLFDWLWAGPGTWLWSARPMLNTSAWIRSAASHLESGISAVAAPHRSKNSDEVRRGRTGGPPLSRTTGSLRAR